MDHPALSGGRRRFQIALALSLFLHGAGGLTGSFRGIFLPEAKKPRPPVVATQFVYLEETGQRFQRGATPGDPGPPTLLEQNSKAFQPYLDQLRGKLQQTIRYLPGEPSAEVWVHFVLGRDGNLLKTQLLPRGAEPSLFLKEEVLRGFQAASPFPPLPSAWSRQRASFTLRVLFREGEG
ncbi:MAG: hypothetical protein HYZ90_02765 [Candidatus Omnitrophica bacterium]|nr:hypothetical protein [Candidatus Omnitrophota bacterium]